MKKPTDQDEQRVAGEIRKYLLTIETLIDVHQKNYERETAPGSAMALDDSVSDPIQMTSLIQYCQNMAIDALRAFKKIVSDGDGLDFPQTAHYGLLRTAMESSAQTIWLLGPDSQRDRIVRLLAARSDEHGHETGMINAMASADPEDQHAEKSLKNSYLKRHSQSRNLRNGWIRSVASPFNIARPEYENQMPGYGPMMEIAALRIGAKPSIIRTAWHFVSGLTHPSSTRGMMASVVEEVETVPAGLVKTNMSTDLRFVHFALMIALRLYLAAANLVLERRGLLTVEPRSMESSGSS